MLCHVDGMCASSVSGWYCLSHCGCVRLKHSRCAQRAPCLKCWANGLLASMWQVLCLRLQVSVWHVLCSFWDVSDQQRWTCSYLLAGWARAVPHVNAVVKCFRVLSRDCIP